MSIRGKGRNCQIPQDFEVTDDHRRYCSDHWGHPKLADALLLEFIATFTENERPHKNWDSTFKNYIRRESPGGKFYNADYWERMINKAKQLEGMDRKRTHRYDPQERSEPKQERSISELGMDYLDKLRGDLRS